MAVTTAAKSDSRLRSMDSAGGGRGLGVDQLPAVVHDREAGEPHARILPRQPLVRDVAPYLGGGFLYHCQHHVPRRATVVT